MQSTEQTAGSLRQAWAGRLGRTLLACWLSVPAALGTPLPELSPLLFWNSDPSPLLAGPVQSATAVPASALRRLNPAALTRLNRPDAAIPPRLVLNLHDDTEYAATFERSGQSGAGGVVWTGSVENRPGSLVTLAVCGGAIAGTVLIPGDGVFQLHPAGNGWQRVVKVDANEQPRCGMHGHERRDLGDRTPIGAVAQSGLDDGLETNAIIDLLMVYTAEAREGAGGTEGMNALLDAAVTEANLAFENSRVNVQLRLVHRAEITYQETGDINEDLDHLEDDAEDGPLRTVQQLRRLHRADLVCMITETTGGPFGLANQMDELDVEFGEKAFSIVKREFAISYQTLAHEIGHNMGCQHDRATSPTGGLHAFSHAHRFEVDGILYHTVMAYQPGLPIPHFSNPDVEFLGLPTGVPEGLAGAANNARTLNLSAATVGRFDSMLPKGSPPSIRIVAPIDGARFTLPSVVELTAEASDPDGHVTEVEFYVNGTRYGERMAPPYRLLWSHPTPGTFSFRAEAKDDDGWEVTSSKVTIVLVHPPPSIDTAGSRLLADRTFQVRIQGVNGQAFRLETSRDLARWSLLTTDSLIGEAFEFVDSSPTNDLLRFYRVLAVP